MSLTKVLSRTPLSIPPYGRRNVFVCVWATGKCQHILREGRPLRWTWMATFVFTTESVDQAGVRLVLIFSPHGNRMNVSLQDGPEEKEA